MEPNPSRPPRTLHLGSPHRPELSAAEVPPVAPSHPPTRVLCVDDSPDIAKTLARLIRGQPDMEDAGVLHSADGIEDEVVQRRVDVVVLDLTMPGKPPLEAICALADRDPSCRVIVFSGYDDAETMEEARRAGACELVSKHGEPADLIRAIRRVAAQGRPEASPIE